MLYMWMIFSMSYKIMKTKWYKLNIGNKKIIYRKTVDGLFLFFPKLSRTFLYLEVEKATDQKFGSKSRLNTLKIEWACQSAGVLPDRIPDKSKDNRSEDACDGVNGLGVPFKDKFNKTVKLYSLMTTKPEEVEARKQKEIEE